MPTNIDNLKAIHGAMRALDGPGTPNRKLHKIYTDLSDQFMTEATQLYGADRARKLHAYISTADKETLEDCISAVLRLRIVHVALYDGPGQDTRAVCVFDNANDAYSWADEDPPGGGVRYTQAVDYIPAAPALPAALASDGNLEMLAADIAKAVSDYGYAEHGFDVGDDAILAALPEFVAGALSEQARLDAQQG